MAPANLLLNLRSRILPHQSWQQARKRGPPPQTPNRSSACNSPRPVGRYKTPQVHIAPGPNGRGCAKLRTWACRPRSKSASRPKSGSSTSQDPENLWPSQDPHPATTSGATNQATTSRAPSRLTTCRAGGRECLTHSHRNSRLTLRLVSLNLEKFL